MVTAHSQLHYRHSPPLFARSPPLQLVSKSAMKARTDAKAPLPLFFCFCFLGGFPTARSFPPAGIAWHFDVVASRLPGISGHCLFMGIMLSVLCLCELNPESTPATTPYPPPRRPFLLQKGKTSTLYLRGIVFLGGFGGSFCYPAGSLGLLPCVCTWGIRCSEA